MLQHTCILQHTATHIILPAASIRIRISSLREELPHYNTLQHTATHCNTLHHTATHCNILQRTATYCNILQHTATYCNTHHITSGEHPHPYKQSMGGGEYAAMHEWGEDHHKWNQHSESYGKKLKNDDWDSARYVCCSVVKCGAVWCSVLQCVAVCCSVLQCVAVY